MEVLRMHFLGDLSEKSDIVYLRNTDEISVDMNSRKTWMLEQIGQSLPDTRDVMVASHLWPLSQIHETF